MVDILLKMRRLPLVFGEVPLVLRYDFKKGPSKLPLGATIQSTLVLLLKRRFNSFTAEGNAPKDSLSGQRRS